jgi:hypothetical protein
VRDFPDYKTVSVDSLIPYARNSRTHSSEQVGQIAASIKEFGFLNPIIVDGDNGIIAGHGRVMAATLLKLEEVPTITLSGLSVSMQRQGVKDSICEDCGAESTVRKDTNPRFCKRCVSVRGGKSKKGRTSVETIGCKNCGKPVRKSLGYTYCSIACKKAGSHEPRVCKECGKTFEIYKSALRVGTNASGNFCSRQCYNKWMCKTSRVTGRGSRWKKIRDKAISRHPFCALCGTTHNLQVHHISPFRLTHDNSQENLIPLCTKHHKVVESITHDVEYAGSSPEDMTLIMGSMLKECQMATRMKLMEIIRATA